MEISFKISSSETLAEINQNGRITRRLLSVPQMLKILSEAVGESYEDNEYFTTPLLPPGTIWYQEDLQKPEAYWLAIFQPADIKQVIFNDRQYMVGFPPAVYKLQIEEKILRGISVFAVRDVILTPDSVLCYFPYFNTIGGVNICLGGNRITVNHPWEALKVIQMLGHIPYDYAWHTLKTELEGDSLLKTVEGKPFPLEWLVETNMTVNYVLSGATTRGHTIVS